VIASKKKICSRGHEYRVTPCSKCYPGYYRKKDAIEFKARVWIYRGISTHSSNAKGMQGSWHFVTLPKKQSDDIKERFGSMKRGWGSLPISVNILRSRAEQTGGTSWKTSIFPDKKAGAYLLPLRADVRRKEKIAEGDIVVFRIEISV
jgi:hypothetical protein